MRDERDKVDREDRVLKETVVDKKGIKADLL